DAGTMDQALLSMEGPEPRRGGCHMPYQPSRLEQDHHASADRMLDAVAETFTTSAAAQGDHMKIFTLPDVGEGLTEADVANWMVKAGDTVTVNQVIAEIETAKSLVEIPSPWAGIVEELYAEVGDTVNVGDNFIGIKVTSTAGDDDDTPQAPLVGTGPKADTPGRRRRRGRPRAAAPAEAETPV